MPKGLPILLALVVSSGLEAQNRKPLAGGPSAQPQQAAPQMPVNAQAVQTPSPQQEARPLSPQQQMPGPPNVSFSNNQLSVTANNSTVQDVINAIHAATGTKFVVQGGPTQDRLFGRFGPGPVSVVLAQILKGSHFNYILISDPARPTMVQTATLMPPATGGMSSAPVQPMAQGGPNGQFQPPTQEIPPDQAAEDETPAPEPAPEVPPQGGQVQFPVQVNNGQYPQVIQTGPNQNANDPNQPKTPEQLLQELQRLQQMRIQQQQQQQQQNPQNPQ